MKFEILQNMQEYDDFVTTHPLCNLLQSSKWAQIKDNWKHIVVGVREQDKLLAGAMILIKPLPLSFTMFYIPRGPILDYENKELVNFFFTNLRVLAKKQHCLFVKVDPGIHVKDYKIDEVQEQMYPNISSILANMRAAGLHHKGFSTYIKESIQPRFQANVYQSDTFLEDLPRHTRRLIKDALKRDVEIVRADTNRLQEFSDVVALTEKRKQVNLRNHDYFKKLMEIYGDDAYLYLAQVNISKTLAKLQVQKQENDKEIAALGEDSPKKQRRLMDIHNALERDIKEFEGFVHEYPERTVIAGILSIRYGDTLEMLYAGMNDNFKKFMPQYHLYTQNMQAVFEDGCKFANMGGIEGDLKDGLTKFKANFAPYVNEFIGEFDLPVNKVFYHISEKVYEIRKKRQNAKKDAKG